MDIKKIILILQSILFAGTLLSLSLNIFAKPTSRIQNKKLHKIKTKKSVKKAHKRKNIPKKHTPKKKKQKNKPKKKRATKNNKPKKHSSKKAKKRTQNKKAQPISIAPQIVQVIHIAPQISKHTPQDIQIHKKRNKQSYDSKHPQSKELTKELNRYRRMVIITEQKGHEQGYGPMTKRLQIALFQKKSPILVSIPLLKNMLKKSGRKIVPNSWHIFACPGNYFILCVPTQYLHKKTGNKDLNFNSQMDRKLGLKLSTLRYLKFPKTSIKYSEYFGIINKEIANHEETLDIESLRSIFVSHEDNPELIWNILMAGHGSENLDRVTGLKLKEFTDVLEFFNTYIHTEFLYYCTCYGGNPKIINEIKKIETPEHPINYIIASRAVSAAAVMGASKKDFNLNYLFEKIEAKEPYEIVLGKEQAYKGAIPQILYPGTQWFSLLNINKQIINISRCKIIKHLIENKPLIIKDQKGIYLSEQINPISIIIEQDQAINIIPKAIYNNYYFEQITAYDLLQLLKSLITTHESKQQQLFIIHKIKLAEPYLGNRELNNVKIQIDRKKQNLEIYYDIESNETHYKIEMHYELNKYKIIIKKSTTTACNKDKKLDFNNWQEKAQETVKEYQDQANHLRIAFMRT